MPQAHTRILQPQDLPTGPAVPPGNPFPVPSSLPSAPGLPAGPALPPGSPGAGSSFSPQAAAAAAGAAMSAAQTQYPSEIPGIYDNLVRLPGGLNLGNDSYIWTAVIRELTGADEEKMARASQSGNMFHFLETLLACGTEQLGDKSPAETAQLLPKLLTGDRDMLALAIRTATYGPEFEVLDYMCPLCGGITARITCSLLPEPAGDVKLRTLDHPDDAVFDVPLRHGGIASVRLPNGEDQKYLADFLKVTGSERNSALLRRCVTRIHGTDGLIRDIAAEPSVVLSMSAGDRKSILKELNDRQPGPQLMQGVRFTHIDCGKEVALPLTMGGLFL